MSDFWIMVLLVCGGALTLFALGIISGIQRERTFRAWEDEARRARDKERGGAR